MNKNDASVIKILTDLGLAEEKPLTAEQEYAMRYATDADFKFSEDIKKTFTQPQTIEIK